MAKKLRQHTILHPPIITVLGHVDHGKTTLLDTIRKTNIVLKEHGGITQHIGAYQIDVPQEIKNKQKQSPAKITFIDTPGHAAFAKMRSRGAKVADIAILVVAANDGVKPQTLESIEYIKSAKIPCIVAINKIDLPDVNLEKIKKQLLKANLKLEEYGGEIPVVPLSAKTGQGLEKLLETILLITDLYQVKEKDPQLFKAIIIESILTKNKGVTTTIIVRNGSLQIGDTVVCDNQSFRVRSLTNWQGQLLSEIKVGDPAEVLGWQKLPMVGSILIKKDQRELSNITPAKPTSKTQPQNITAPSPTDISKETIKLIIKADTLGTLEAIEQGLKNDIEVIFKGVGNINESDILLAKTTKAIVISFNQNPSESVKKLAQTEKVIIKTYNIIYELFDEIDDVIEAIRKGELVEVLGKANIIALFPYSEEVVAGAKVISGRIARGDKVKIMRGEEEIGKSKIKSLKHFKEDINKAETGQEIGILLSQKIDFLTGDSIISIG